MGTKNLKKSLSLERSGSGYLPFIDSPLNQIIKFIRCITAIVLTE